MRAELTIGPILYHWPVDTRRDFYFRLADDPAVDTVYLGETVCSKRLPLFQPGIEAIIERLLNADKKVIISSLAEVIVKRDLEQIRDVCTSYNHMIEVNDSSALSYLAGKPFAIGPFLNIYNEDSLAYMAGKGAVHTTLPPEMPGKSIAVMAGCAKNLHITTEVMVYGRIPLALSARCYHARAHDRTKDNCQFVCVHDPDGMNLHTMDNQPLLAINGIQTLSYNCLNLVNELKAMQAAGVDAFRLSPQSHDMSGVISLFRDVLDDNVSPDEAASRFEETEHPFPYANGFYHKQPGYKWV